MQFNLHVLQGLLWLFCVIFQRIKVMIAHSCVLSLVSLHSWMRKREVSLLELALDVEQLTRLAYPDAVELVISISV